MNWSGKFGNKHVIPIKGYKTRNFNQRKIPVWAFGFARNDFRLNYINFIF